MPKNLCKIMYYWKNTNVSIAEMSEAFHSIELNVFSIGLFLYVLLLQNLNPLIIFSFSEVFSNYRFEKAYITSFFIGSSISLGITIVLLFIGFYQYYGTLISFEESLFALTGIAVRVLLLCGFVYLEEFIFRRKIFNLLRQNFSNIAAIALTTILYLAMKFYQFDIGLKHMLSLTLISVSLCLRALKKEDFCYGAGILSGILVFFHPISSLPIFGYELPGLVLIKHQTTSEMIGWLTGGAGGPLSSFI
ncbi:MAG: hypothetical protein HY072_02155, partial [Deltaproteobacteria bacterium]|nr:hypothetical protein [Deltaproteobacteria bacterium]